MSPSDYKTLLLDVDEGVATVTLNRPEQLNTMSYEMDRELRDAFATLDADDSIRAIVVTGAGRAFCAGVDLTPETFGPAHHEEHDRVVGVSSDALPEHYASWKMRTPIIAAINGAAVGAGLTVPLLWDIRYAAEDAKLGFVFTRRGIIPEANSLWLLPRIVGVSRALELLISGRFFSGKEAAEMGLVSKALPRDEVLPAAQALAREIARDTAPAPVAVVKRLVYRFLQETDREAAFAFETKMVWWAGERPDAAEGVMSFLEKRVPQWRDSKNAPIPDQL